MGGTRSTSCRCIRSAVRRIPSPTLLRQMPCSSLALGSAWCTREFRSSKSQQKRQQVRDPGLQSIRNETAATRSWMKTTIIKRLFPKTWLSSFTGLNNHKYRSRREITTSLRTEHRLFLIRSWLTVPSLEQRPMALAIE
jgi:hypothetical protein